MIQCRDLLAHLLSAQLNTMGNKTSPNDFIPHIESPASELEKQRAKMELWAIRYNAQVH